MKTEFTLDLGSFHRAAHALMEAVGGLEREVTKQIEGRTLCMEIPVQVDPLRSEDPRVGTRLTEKPRW